jgi:hypothetical protein
LFQSKTFSSVTFSQENKSSNLIQPPESDWNHRLRDTALTTQVARKKKYVNLLLMGSTFFLPFAAARPIGNRKF